MEPKTQNKIVTVAILVLAVVLVVAASFIYQKSITKLNEQIAPKQPTIVQKQIDELNKLRQEANAKTLTQEQTSSQIEELDALRQEATKTTGQTPSGGIKAASAVDAKTQLEELNKLHSQVSQ